MRYSVKVFKNLDLQYRRMLLVWLSLKWYQSCNKMKACRNNNSCYE